MHLSTHYYAISLGERESRLYECFRETAIDIRNQGFPVTGEPGRGEEALDRRLRAVDKQFAHHYAEERLNLVLVGEAGARKAFGAMTAHAECVIGEVDGDHSTTDERDMGQIVWPVVRRLMSGLGEMVLRELELAAGTDRLLTGIAAVSAFEHVQADTTLLVEDDYHVRGSVTGVGQSDGPSRDVDLQEGIDDAVDMVVESVMMAGGRVIFMKNDSLKDQERIAMILSW